MTRPFAAQIYDSTEMCRRSVRRSEATHGAFTRPPRGASGLQHPEALNGETARLRRDMCPKRRLHVSPGFSRWAEEFMWSIPYIFERDLIHSELRHVQNSPARSGVRAVAVTCALTWADGMRGG